MFVFECAKGRANLSNVSILQHHRQILDLAEKRSILPPNTFNYTEKMFIVSDSSVKMFVT
jgi:hypothetical protein